MHVYVIAEAGVNHNGEIELAHALIDAAAEAGADAVKFQTFHAEDMVSASAPKARYQTRTTPSSESQLEMIRRLELDEPAHVELMEHCHGAGLDFISSPFDRLSIELLDRLGLQVLKVPSGELTNLPYLRSVGALGRRLIVSTGMADMSEVAFALDVLVESGTALEDIVVLQCTTEYPAPYEEVNLRAMCTMRDTFGVRVGYSDHTVGPEVAVAAVALGASVIEKHLTLDRGMTGPDHAASAEPQEFAAMVSALRHVEVALGSGEKEPTPSERRNAAVARKSIVAARRIEAGTVIRAQDLSAKRPGTGMSPARWDALIGRRASRTYEADELIDLSEVEGV